MMDITGGLKGLTDRGRWAARGASFVAKAKATKVVWFPPAPAETGKKASSAAKKTTKKATKGAAKRTSGAAKRTSGAAKKSTGAAKKVAPGVK